MSPLERLIRAAFLSSLVTIPVGIALIGRCSPTTTAVVCTVLGFLVQRRALEG